MIINLSNGETLIERLFLANKFLKRLIGLLPFKYIKSSEGMLLTPCKDVHTCFMKFPIDIVCLDKNLKVVAVHINIMPWRFIKGTKDTVSVLELSAGVADKIQPGHQLKVINK